MRVHRGSDHCRVDVLPFVEHLAKIGIGGGRRPGGAYDLRRICQPLGIQVANRDYPNAGDLEQSSKQVRTAIAHANYSHTNRIVR